MNPGENLTQLVQDSLKKERLTLHQGDILAVVSKIVSTCENRVVKLADVRVTPRARRLSRRWRLDERLATLVLKEADEVLGGVNGFLLTVKDGFLTPNAGVDLKNAPPGTAALWPIDPDRSASNLRRSLEGKFRTKIGVEIVDSHVTALRLGTVGLAIGLSGFRPILDHRGISDLFGRAVRVTQTNVADDVAAAAHVIMGESSERVGAVLVRGMVIGMHATDAGRLAKLNRERCLIGNSLIRRLTPLRIS